jgi:CheY-like chemotaxis protein
MLVGLRAPHIADAENAWRPLAKDGLVFDVITVDLRLSGLSGRALFERLERELPALAARVIFITGDIGDADSEAFLERSGRPTLRKPFRVKALTSSLATVLAAGPAPTQR